MATLPPKPAFQAADETTLTLHLPPLEAPQSYTLQYKEYTEEWTSSAVKEVKGLLGGPQKALIDDLIPLCTFCIRVSIVDGSGDGDVGEVVWGEEIVLDTAAPGCSGGKKKKKTCIIS
jgi:hypothetical protein